MPATALPVFTGVSIRERLSIFYEGDGSILEKLIKALLEWLASLWYELVEYLLGSLLELFRTDLSYFSQRVPVMNDIAAVLPAVGWALLIGNLAYQAMRAMASGTGIEAEEPGRLFLRTAMFSFLLLASRQICNVGLGISSAVMELLQVPAAVTFRPFDADYFTALPNAGWLVVILVNLVIQWQLVRLFFEVAERYVVLCVLTYCAPLAFAMGGSKSTGEIFRGWARMFASMCALMVFNLLFVKMTLSALSESPSGAAIIPWTMLITGILRMAKKMDGILLRIGMNPAQTGDPLGSRLPGMLTMLAARTMLSTVMGTVATPPQKGQGGGTSGRTPKTPHGAKPGPPQGNPPQQSGPAPHTEYRTAGSNSAPRPADGTAAPGRGRTPDENRTAPAPSPSGAASRRRANGGTLTPEQRRALTIEADDFADGEDIREPAPSGIAPEPPVPGHRITPPIPAVQPAASGFGSAPPPAPVPGGMPRISPSPADGTTARQAYGPADKPAALPQYSRIPPAPQAARDIEAGVPQAEPRPTPEAFADSAAKQHTESAPAGKIRIRPDIPTPAPVSVSRAGPASGAAAPMQTDAALHPEPPAAVSAGTLPATPASAKPGTPARTVPAPVPAVRPRTVNPKPASPAAIVPTPPHTASGTGTGSTPPRGRTGEISPRRADAGPVPAGSGTRPAAPRPYRPVQPEGSACPPVQPRHERLDISPVPDRTAAAHRPVAEPRTLRRSAQPLTPPERNGGDRNRKRKKKK